MFKGKSQTSLIVLMSIFLSAVSMQAQAWSYGISWYSTINTKFLIKGNRYKLDDGNWVISNLFESQYNSVCVNVKTGKKTWHGGIGNNGDDILDINELNQSDGSGRNKGTWFADGELSFVNSYQHYTLHNYGSGDGSLNCYGDPSDDPTDESLSDPTKPPTGICTEADRNPDHPVDDHFCAAGSVNKVEYRDWFYFPWIAVWVRVVEGEEDGSGPKGDGSIENPYIVLTQGIVECEYTGEVSFDKDGFTTETLTFEDTKDDCFVTEYDKSILDPTIGHVLSF